MGMCKYNLFVLKVNVKCIFNTAEGAAGPSGIDALGWWWQRLSSSAVQYWLFQY